MSNDHADTMLERKNKHFQRFLSGLSEPEEGKEALKNTWDDLQAMQKARGVTLREAAAYYLQDMFSEKAKSVMSIMCVPANVTHFMICKALECVAADATIEYLIKIEDKIREKSN